jgi:cobalamin biosynthesis Mg chelatase CobN
MRSYVLAGNTGHYDGVIKALEARGLRVIPPSPAASTRARRSSVLHATRASRSSMPSCR